MPNCKENRTNVLFTKPYGNCNKNCKVNPWMQIKDLHPRLWSNKWNKWTNNRELLYLRVSFNVFYCIEEVGNKCPYQIHKSLGHDNISSDLIFSIIPDYTWAKLMELVIPKFIYQTNNEILLENSSPSRLNSWCSFERWITPNWCLLGENFCFYKDPNAHQREMQSDRWFNCVGDMIDFYHLGNYGRIMMFSRLRSVFFFIIIFLHFYLLQDCERVCYYFLPWIFFSGIVCGFFFLSIYILN